MLDRKTFLVKERVGFLKFADVYDIYDPASGMKIGIAQEAISPWLKLFRLLVKKHLLPTTVEIRAIDENGPLLLKIYRGAVFFRARVTVHNGLGKDLGYFKAKFFSLGGGFHVHDSFDKQIAEIKGDWKGWNFRLLSAEGIELGKVTKKWAGLGKEMFTSADNYIIALQEGRALPPDTAALLLAAGIAIDVVYKER